MGFPRVESDVETIFQIMKWFIDEIERRKQEDGHPIIVCLDEINDTLSELEHLDLVKPLPGKEKRRNTFIYAIRKLSNARKFDICLTGFMQSHNTEAIGIDAKFRNNFLLILCGASARGEIQNVWKHDTPGFQYIKNAAYPVVISGSNPHQIAEHPTHKHHTQYRKKGNAPANLIQPRFLDKSSIPVFESEQSEDFDEDYQPRQPSKPEPHLPRFNFDKPPLDSDYPNLSIEQAKIVRWVVKQGGKVKLNEMLKGLTISSDGERWTKQNYLNACRFIADKGYLLMTTEGETIWLEAPTPS
jgi:hypothetical protein